MPARPLGIAEGRTPGGSTLGLEDFGVRSRVSRAVVAEVRVPKGLATVTSRRRTGPRAEAAAGMGVAP